MIEEPWQILAMAPKPEFGKPRPFFLASHFRLQKYIFAKGSLVYWVKSLNLWWQKSGVAINNGWTNGPGLNLTRIVRALFMPLGTLSAWSTICHRPTLNFLDSHCMIRCQIPKRDREIAFFHLQISHEGIALGLPSFLWVWDMMRVTQWRVLQLDQKNNRCHMKNRFFTMDICNSTLNGKKAFWIGFPSCWSFVTTLDFLLVDFLMFSRRVIP